METKQWEWAIISTAARTWEEIIKHKQEQLKKILAEEKDARRKAKQREKLI